MQRLFGHFLQNAYVTNDRDRAKSEFAEQYGVKQFIDIDNSFEVITPEGLKDLELKISLAFIDGLQVEIIEPMGGSASLLYQQSLPSDEFRIVFHHSCFVIPGSKEEWFKFRKQVDERGITVAIEAELGPVNFCYLDTRKALGHYCEYIWSADDIQSMVPRN